MTDASNDPGTTQNLLEQRYGRGRKRAFDTRFAWITGGVLVLAGAVFLLFGGWQQGSGVDFRDLDYSVVDDRTVTVDAQITIPINTPAVCAFEALSESFATVGWKLIELPASEQHTRLLSTTLITTSPATTGTVSECWTVE